MAAFEKLNQQTPVKAHGEDQARDLLAAQPLRCKHIERCIRRLVHVRQDAHSCGGSLDCRALVGTILWYGIWC